jgi:hypothetical protein
VRRKNPTWSKDLKSYLDNIQKRDLDVTTVNTSAKEKFLSFTTTDKAFTERSSQDQEKTRSDRQPKNRSEIKMVASHVAIIIRPAKLSGPGSVTTGRKESPLPGLRINWPEKLKIQTPWAASIFSNPKLRKNSLNHSFEE